MQRFYYMNTRLLSYVVLCLLRADPMETQVTQIPRHFITKTGKKLTVTCSQNMNHDAMYWYRKDPGLGLKLIYYSINTDNTNEGDIPGGYKVSRKEKKNFPLTLESTSINQSSVYFCASSVSTAEHSQLLCAQKGKPGKEGDSALQRPLPSPGKTLSTKLVTREVLTTPNQCSLSTVGDTHGTTLIIAYDAAEPCKVQARQEHCTGSNARHNIRIPFSSRSLNPQMQLNCCSNSISFFQSTCNNIWSHIPGSIPGCFVTVWDGRNTIS